MRADGTRVEVAEVIEDTRSRKEGMLRATGRDANGYVAFPVNPAEDMVDLLGASRGYQANVAAMTAVKDMLHRSLELLR
jgi:flagellar basal-body rod protein FlgC